MTVNFDHLPCAYISFRDDGVITACNIKLASWLGYAKEEISGKSIENLFTLATRIFYNTHFFPLIKLHSEAREIFLSLKDKGGQEIPVLANADRLLVKDDYIIHCVFIRVEERKKFEQELIQARRQAEAALKENKQLEELSKSLKEYALDLDRQYRQQLIMNENLVQFSKIISHDLQEPIRKIQMFKNLISEDQKTVLSPKSKSILLKIEAAAARLKALTISLQEYISVNNEKNYTEIDLNEVVATAKSRAANLRQFFDLDLEMEALPKIEGYRKQLELLFFHLIDNAIQFKSPARKLVIKVTHLVLEENVFKMSQDQYRYTENLWISFEDNGIGFSNEYQEYVFQLFAKLDNSTSGLGIGLPLVKKIVQNHSGDIRLTSEVGSGTRIEIDLPMKVK